jgi:hypothetical protein
VPDVQVAADECCLDARDEQQIRDGRFTIQADGDTRTYTNAAG